MSDAQRQNNLTLGLAIAAGAALVCLGLPWGTFVVQGQQGLTAMMNGQTVTISGTNGSIGFAGVSLPTWLLCLLAASAAAVAILRVRAVVSVPTWLVAAPAAGVALLALVGAATFAANGGVGIGVVVIAVASATTSILAFAAQPTDAT